MPGTVRSSVDLKVNARARAVAQKIKKATEGSATASELSVEHLDTLHRKYSGIHTPIGPTQGLYTPSATYKPILQHKVVGRDGVVLLALGAKRKKKDKATQEQPKLTVTVDQGVAEGGNFSSYTHLASGLHTARLMAHDQTISAVPEEENKIFSHADAIKTLGTEDDIRATLNPGSSSLSKSARLDAPGPKSQPRLIASAKSKVSRETGTLTKGREVNSTQRQESPSPIKRDENSSDQLVHDQNLESRLTFQHLEGKP